MRDHDRGGAERVVQLADELPDDRERDRVEPGKGLVIEDEHRVEHQRAGERHAPRHAAGELRGHEPVRSAQPHGLELHQHEIAHHRLREAGVLAQREGDVLVHAHVGEEGSELEQHAHAPAHPVERMAIEPVHGLARDPHLARGRAQLASDDAKERGLAAAARAHDGDDLPARHAQRDSLEDRPAPVGEAHRLDVDENILGHARIIIDR